VVGFAVVFAFVLLLQAAASITATAPMAATRADLGK